MTVFPVIYALSDSIGETAESVARATASQFDSGNKIDIIRIPFINTVDQLNEIIAQAAKQPCIICHTIVSPELREAIVEYTAEHSIPNIDIMGGMMESIEKITGLKPRMKPGLIHKLDKDYFRRVEAIEFAVKYDDGKNPWGFLKADIVLIGISRTSKTPLSMYLARKSFKVANLPLVPEVPVPEEIFQVDPNKIVGLIIDPRQLNSIRAERLKGMGLGVDGNYANMERIQEELAYASDIMRKIGCPVLDVSRKAIEETANKILEIVNRETKS